MEAAFSWIGDLARWLANLIPRWDICRATHGGVKFVRGWKVKPIRPGIYWYWPAVTECVLIPVVRHPVDLPAQSLTTKDGKAVMLSVTYVVEITDVVRALGKTWEIDDMIRDVGRGAAGELVPRLRFTELRDPDVKDDLAKTARRLLRPYGVRIVRARLTDCTKNLVIRTVGDGALVPVPEEEVEE
jgi:regulator of protease activity HflC (stomatin/prohibitin superfamily)